MVVVWRVGSSGSGSTGDHLPVHLARHGQLSVHREYDLGRGFVADLPRQRLADGLHERHLDQRADAPQLQEKWNVSVTAPISAQPIVDDGVVYWGDWNGLMHATTVSGTARWSISLGTTPRPPGCPFTLATQGILSTPTIGMIGGRRVLWAGGGRAQMVALDASSGKIVWQTPLGTEPGSSIWSSPAYYKGSIYVGLASFQGCPQEFGRIVDSTRRPEHSKQLSTSRRLCPPSATGRVHGHRPPSTRRKTPSSLAPRTTSATRVTKTPSSG